MNLPRCAACAAPAPPIDHMRPADHTKRDIGNPRCFRVPMVAQSNPRSFRGWLVATHPTIGCPFGCLPHGIPLGRMPIVTVLSISPCATSFTVPSPPTAKAMSNFSATARWASSVALPR